MMEAFVESLALLGPGLINWNESAAVLRDPQTYRPTKVVLDDVGATTANERRRTTPLIRLALRVLEQLSARSSFNLAAARSVFATSWGDYQVIDSVLFSLTLPGVPVSPVHFHNVVHNTPAGYWSIGAGARGLSTSLSAAETTVAAGLMEAFVCLGDGDAPVVLVGYDCPLPPTLDRFHHIVAPFAVAMTLSAQRTEACICAMRLEILPNEPATRMAHAGLERLRAGNPAAQALPILEVIATGIGGRVTLPATVRGSCLAVHITPLRQPVRHDEAGSSDDVAAAVATADVGG